MPYYHATWQKNLPSILKHGLGGVHPERRNFECETGVYLATDPAVAIYVLMEAAVNDSRKETSSPNEVMGALRLIVVDDGRIDGRLCRPDPNVEMRNASVIYGGVIDVRGMPVIDLDTAVASFSGS